LAELLALPVIERRERTNFPASHGLHQGFDPASLIQTADVVLVLDHDVPYIPTQISPASTAAIIQIDVDPVKERIPLWTFRLTWPIRADTGCALAEIARYASNSLTDTARRRIESRRATLSAAHARQRSGWAAAARSVSAVWPISPLWLGYCLGQLHREVPD